MGQQCCTSARFKVTEVRDMIKFFDNEEHVINDQVKKSEYDRVGNRDASKYILLSANDTHLLNLVAAINELTNFLHIVEATYTVKKQKVICITGEEQLINTYIRLKEEDFEDDIVQELLLKITKFITDNKVNL